VLFQFRKTDVAHLLCCLGGGKDEQPQIFRYAQDDSGELTSLLSQV